MSDDDAAGTDVAATLSMHAIFDRLEDVLENAELPLEAVIALVALLAETYELGARDGARDVVAQVAGAVRALGLDLHLAPELCSDGTGGGEEHGPGRATGPSDAV